MATRALNHATKPRVSERAATRHPIAGHHGVGGDLEAFTRLLLHFPAHTGMAFVLAQQSNPQHERAPSQLLSLEVKIPVRGVTNELLRPCEHGSK